MVDGVSIASQILTGIPILAAAVVAVIVAWRTNRTVEKVHILVNSGHTANLRLLAKTARRLAIITKDPADDLDYENALKDLNAAEEATRAIERKEASG